MLHNDTFQQGPTWSNACVGNNGSPQIHEYASGFAKSALLVMEAVIRDRSMKLHIDEFIYPICFNMRHSVELWLKKSVEDLEELYKFGGVLKSLDSTKIHDLNILWQHVRDNSIEFDDRFEPIVMKMDGYVKDIIQIDLTGQVFRYPYSHIDEKHLVDTSIISVVPLYQRFVELNELIKSLMRMSETLIGEYSRGTFIANKPIKLNRKQLFLLAAEVMPRAQWGTYEFKENKKHLMTKYGLSSNNFNQALRLIEKNYEMSGLIQQQLLLATLAEHDLQLFLDAWAQLHDLDKIRHPPDPCIVSFDSDLDKGQVFDYNNSSKKLIDDLVVKLTKQGMATIKTLFYFARDNLNYSEDFEKKLNFELEGVHKLEGADFWRYINHVFSKTSALEHILNSMNFLNQADMLESLISRYKLESCRDRLLKESEIVKARRYA